MIFYRYQYRAEQNGKGTELQLKTFQLVEETPKGYWIAWRTDRLWVSKTSKKRYAYPSKMEALTNLIKRTELREKILEIQLHICESVLILASQENEKLKKLTL